MHIHKYRRTNIARKGNPEYYVMQCQLENCSHYTPMKSKLACPSLIGKTTLCNDCSTEFTIDRRAMKQAKPTCIFCSKKKSKLADKLDNAAKFFDDLTKDLQP